MEYIVLRISNQTLVTIGAALRELPYKLAQPAIAEIDAQVQSHVRKRDEDLHPPDEH